MQNKEFKTRREKLFAAMESNSLAIVFCAKNPINDYQARQNSDFYYLTGFIEPQAAAVFSRKNGERKYILFVPEADSKKVTWEGSVINPKDAIKSFGANKAFTIAELNKALPRLLDNHKIIYASADSDGKFDPRIKATHLHNLNPILDELRLRKSQYELKAIRKAVEITTQAHLRAMQSCSPGMHEYELEAEILHEFTSCGCHPAYPTIVASGINACTLHYSKNRKKLKAGELVLIDAGTKYEHYSADVSRTFPVNGKFSSKQRQIYEIVLAAQFEVIKNIRPGIKWDLLQNTAEKVITLGLIEAKLLKGEHEQLVSNQKFLPFFMHRIGHWLGLDTHDVGQYKVKNKWVTLEPGMVLTVEPGIYCKSMDLGVRIEDDILVTKNGCEILSDKIPKQIADIEELMKSGTRR